jgi:hypothetical protein
MISFDLLLYCLNKLLEYFAVILATEYKSGRRGWATKSPVLLVRSLIQEI